jgi:hypothetical protein
MPDQFNTDQNDEAMQKATQAAMGIVPAPEQSTAIVPRQRDAGGKFVPRQKLSKAQKSQQTLQRVLAKKDETGRTLEERVATHLLETAEKATESGLMAAAKAFETVEARAHGKVPDNEQTLEALQRQSVRVVILGAPELMHPETLTEEQLRPAVPKRPSFADVPFIEGTVVSTNSVPAPKLPEPKKAKEDKPPQKPCTCEKDSPVYCEAHRPYFTN